MTVINTNYSSLEDAWGGNFELPADTVTKKSKKNKKDDGLSGQSDPLCGLYNKRYRKLKKPYGKKSSYPLDDEYVNRYSVYKGDDRTNYYGYRDDDFNKLSNPSRQSTNLLTIDPNEDDDYRCVNVNAIPVEKYDNNKTHRKKDKKEKKDIAHKVRFIEPEDEDDLYLQNAVSQEEYADDDADADGADDYIEQNTTFEDVVSKNTKFDRIYSNVYDETDDEVTNEDDLIKITKTTKTESEDEDSYLINKELERKSQLVKVQTDISGDVMNNSKERNYLDFVIYLLSGFILIFMMEQFIQIGIQMRVR